MAGAFLALGVSQLATLPGSSPIVKWVHLGIGVGFTLIGAAYLTTTIALRRRQRVTLDSPTGTLSKTEPS